MHNCNNLSAKLESQLIVLFLLIVFSKAIAHAQQKKKEFLNMIRNDLGDKTLVPAFFLQHHSNKLKMQAIPIKEDDPTFPIHCCNKDKFHTEVIRIVFSDKIVFVITQVNSLGGIVIKAEQDTNMSGNNFLEDFDDSSNYSMEPTYSIKTIFGKRAPSIESPQSDTFIDIEGIFTRRLIQQLYKGNNQTTKQQPFMMMGFEQHVPLSVLAKPLMVEVAFSKEFSDLLKEPSIGRELMKELIDCIVI